MVLAGLLHAAFCERRRKQVAAENSVATTTASSSTGGGGGGGPHTAAHATTNGAVADLSQYPSGAISIYYGTQTGTAESFARDLERQLSQKQFLVHVVDLEDVSHLNTLAERAIVLTATYGEGEAPDNAALFSNWLEQKTGVAILDDFKNAKAVPTKHQGMLAHVEFAVFGLGNKQYDHYNAMGKYFDHTFGLLGAKRIASLGLGDDDDDIEADFENWREQALMPALEKYQEETTTASDSTVKTPLPECSISVQYHEGTSAQPVYNIPSSQMHSSSRHYFTATTTKVTSLRTLRSPQDPGQTLHMELDARNLKYTTADNLGVLPVNDIGLVHRLAKALGFDDALLLTAISLEPNDTSEWHGAKFPQPDTVENILQRYYDLQAAPRRADLAALADFCSDPVDRDFLLRLASKEGREEYKTKIVQQYMGWVHVMEKLSSLQMSLAHLLHILPPLQQRFYTIASSSKVHPNTIHLTVALTEHETNDDRMFRGVCTRHLAQSAQQELRVTIRPSTFRLPKSPSTPILLIGPGTGVAPMRAFLQERAYQQQTKKTLGTAILYFGCKRPELDYIYQDELAAWQSSGVLTHLRVAFSRQQSKKVYVQHLLAQHADETWDLIHHQKAHVYVCGGVQMGHDVGETLAAIVQQQGGQRNAKEYLANMSQSGRYVQELWA